MAKLQKEINDSLETGKQVEAQKKTDNDKLLESEQNYAELQKKFENTTKELQKIQEEVAALNTRIDFQRMNLDIKDNRIQDLEKVQKERNCNYELQIEELENKLKNQTEKYQYTIDRGNGTIELLQRERIKAKTEVKNFKVQLEQLINESQVQKDQFLKVMEESAQKDKQTALLKEELEKSFIQQKQQLNEQEKFFSEKIWNLEHELKEQKERFDQQNQKNVGNLQISFSRLAARKKEEADKNQQNNFNKLQ
ncbi:MAG: hypothetical protein ACTSXG_01985 [Alphaproteobacteria bacterium]